MIDWSALTQAAIGVMGKAYAPYSKFPVGVAGLVDDGRIVVGVMSKTLAMALVCVQSAAWFRNSLRLVAAS